MKPRWRPGKKADTSCPQWILDGVKRIHQQATLRRNESLPPTQSPPEIIRKISGDHHNDD